MKQPHENSNDKKLFDILREIHRKCSIIIDRTKPYIERYALKRLIQGQLHITDPHTINGHVDQLISGNYISPNPHTSLSSIQHVYKPNPNTKYFIEESNIETYIKAYLTAHPHTQSTLDKCSSSESQKENKDKLEGQ